MDVPWVVLAVWADEEAGPFVEEAEVEPGEVDEAVPGEEVVAGVVVVAGEEAEAGVDVAEAGVIDVVAIGGRQSVQQLVLV